MKCEPWARVSIHDPLSMLVSIRRAQAVAGALVLKFFLCIGSPFRLTIACQLVPLFLIVAILSPPRVPYGCQEVVMYQKSPYSSMSIGALMIGGERGIFYFNWPQTLVYTGFNLYIILLLILYWRKLTYWFLYIFYFTLILRVPKAPYRSCLAIAPSATSIKPITYSIITTSGWLRRYYNRYHILLIMTKAHTLYAASSAGKYTST